MPSNLAVTFPVYSAVNLLSFSHCDVFSFVGGTGERSRERSDFQNTNGLHGLSSNVNVKIQISQKTMKPDRYDRMYIMR